MLSPLSRSLSIYVHFPYCSKLCTFCAFNKYKVPRDLDHSKFHTHLKKELSYNLRTYADRTDSRAIRSVYFGGGTPSLSPTIVTEVLNQIRSEGFVLNGDAEITLEANPSSLPSVSYLSDVGVTRVSLGVQSLTDDKQLARFGREHTSTQSCTALDTLSRDRDLLSDGFSFDLMFGNPLSKRREKRVAIDRELRLALPYAKIGGHLSIYELTVERSTPLAAQVRSGQVIMPSVDKNAEEYEETVAFMQANHFDHYEISSFALPKHYGQHNFAFWMHEDLIGIGPGAHGRITNAQGTKERTRCIPDPKRWAEQVDALGHGWARKDSLAETFTDECIALGLRTEVGISKSLFLRATGDHLVECLDMDQVDMLEREGLLLWSDDNDGQLSGKHLPMEFRTSFLNGGLRATERGRSVLDLMLPRILRS